LESSGGDIDRFIGWGLCSPPPIVEGGDIDFFPLDSIKSWSLDTISLFLLLIPH
jgi:hypothetical protein